MISNAYSVSFWGIQCFLVRVEADCSLGLPGFSMVGLPDSAVRESRDRVISSIRNNGYQVLNRRVVISLSPADRRKAGSAFDLAIALALLAASGQLEAGLPTDTLFVGELGLSGELLPVRGALAAAVFARQNGFKRLVLPAANRSEVHCINGIDLVAVESLTQTIHWLRTTEQPELPETVVENQQQAAIPNLQEIRGQAGLRRVLEVAAAGGHNFLLSGPPGCGKSASVRCLPGILPPLSASEALETTQIHSLAGLHPPGKGLLSHRPFRSPHHSITALAMSGGGNHPQPGEISLAHHGVLFLDELPEFQRRTLEILRQPLEERRLSISRASYTVTFPASFMFGAAMNPCPCGYLGSSRDCRCSEHEIRQYRNRISGPLADRIDLQLEVAADVNRDWDASCGESSEIVLGRVKAARQMQYERGLVHVRQHNQTADCGASGESELHVVLNSELRGEAVREACALSPVQQRLLKSFAAKLNMSYRGIEKTLKVARTIADLAGKINLEDEHLFEALQYRSLMQQRF